MAHAKRLALVASALALALPASAAASFHLNTVNEVLPPGTASQQFVELKDPAGEPFPDAFGPYYLALFNGAGGFVAKQTLNPDDGFRNSTAPFLVAAAAPRDAALGFTLPAGSGQLCFYRGDPQAAGQRVNCLGYGSISMPLGDTGPLPPAGKSLQRLACGDVGVAAPTRDTENAACPSGGGGGGGGGGSSGDQTDPGGELKASRRRALAMFGVGGR